MNVVLTSSAWEATAKERLAREWHRLTDSGGAAVTSGGDAAGHSPMITGPITWIVPELLDLVMQNHDRPVVYLAPQVHHILTEANFVEESGDGVPPLSAEEIERQRDEVVAVLEKVRLAVMDESRWSDAPMTQLMCG